jgi:uncharacterized membrane protein
MTELPPIPSWDALHPLVVHFPIALLLVAPLFVLAGALLEFRRPGQGRSSLVAALVLVALGTAGTFAATATGEAAGKVTERSDLVDAALEHHESLAETTRSVFAVLTALLATILFLPRLLRREVPRFAHAGLLLAFTLFYGAGAVLLANTAHGGGRLVHELGTSSAAAGGAAGSGAASPASSTKTDD